jgi:hypothetical protein
MHYVIPRHVLLTLICAGWLSSHPAASTAQVSKGALSVGRLSGVFTISDFKSVNGTSQAAGWLTANVTDATGTNDIGRFTNFPVRVPVSGILSGDPVEVGLVSDPVILPELSTNSCSLLGIVIGAIDITIPGIGLNLHVNEISIVVRADRETTVGEILCTLLGDSLLGSNLASASTPPIISLTGNSLVQAHSAKSILTLEQIRGLAGILLGPGITHDAASMQSTSKATAANSPTNSLAQTKTDPKLGLLQNFLHQVIRTMEPSKLAAPAAKPAVP